MNRVTGLVCLLVVTAFYLIMSPRRTMQVSRELAEAHSKFVNTGTNTFLVPELKNLKPSIFLFPC